MAEFVSMKYKKKLGEAKNHVRYIAYRDRSSEDGYGLFNDRSNNVNVTEFISKLDDKRIAHKDIAKVHTVIFSMSGDEWQRSGFERDDYKKMVRNIMEDWQRKHQFKVEWVAAEHFEEKHPHIHVVIKSTCTDRDGIERRLKVNMKDEREWFKEQFRHEKDAIRGPYDELAYQRERRLERAQGRRKQRNKNMGKDVFNVLINQINRRLQQEQYETELEQLRTHRRISRAL